LKERVVSFGGILVLGTVTKQKVFIGDDINDKFECIRAVHGSWFSKWKWQIPSAKFTHRTQIYMSNYKIMMVIESTTKPGKEKERNGD
jgi:hypothetical protein